MITNSMANTDSPIFGKPLSQKLFSTESEFEMCITLNNSYDDIIITDGLTGHNIFEIYLSRDRVASRYAVTPEGDLDWERMGKRMLTWSKLRHELIIRKEIDNNCHAIYDCGVAKAYLGAKRL